jgi:hypothetical protein
MVTFTESLAVSASLSITVKRADGTEEKFESPSETKPSQKANPTEVKIEQEWFFDRFLPNNVLTVCGVQLAKQSQIVNECESQFNLRDV